MKLDFITNIINFKRTVIRNTPILNSSPDEFDDLTDDSYEIEFAQRFTSKTSLKNIIYYHAINYVFSQSRLPPSRFSDGSFPAWYGSLDDITTFYETSFHWINNFLNDMNFQYEDKIYQERSLFKVNCNSLLIDLRNKINKLPALTNKKLTAYKTTQTLGQQIYQQGHPGLYTLSARHEGGENIVVYNPKVLDNASLSKNVCYEYFPDKEKIIVKEYNNNSTITEFYL